MSSLQKVEQMFLTFKYEGIRNRKEGTWGHKMRGNLGVLAPGHVLFFYQKIFIWMGIFKFI